MLVVADESSSDIESLDCLDANTMSMHIHPGSTEESGFIGLENSHV